jgi:hypothetical protein
MNHHELNSNHDGELEPKREMAALCVAMGGRLAEAAGTAGVSHQTVKVWSMSPAFKRRVNQLRAEMTERAMAILADNAASAATTLGYLARKGKAATRLRAAAKLLELLIRFRESVALEERVAMLEEAQSKRPNPRSRIA